MVSHHAGPRTSRPTEHWPIDRTLETPEPTVTTPTFTPARYLPERLESFFDQSFGDLVLIILGSAPSE